MRNVYHVTYEIVTDEDGLVSTRIIKTKELAQPLNENEEEDDG